MTRGWRPLEDAAVATLPVNTGVYAVRERGCVTACVDIAGARSRLGLRGELSAVLAASNGAPLEFTYVSTNNYFTLYREWRDYPDRFDANDPFVRANGVVAQRGSA